MNFDLTEEQVLLKNMVERFVEDRYDLDKRRAYQATPVGFSPENWALLAELGLLALTFPSDLGGLDGGPVELLGHSGQAVPDEPPVVVAAERVACRSRPLPRRLAESLCKPPGNPPERLIDYARVSQ